ncbi:MAG: hypothetical protein EOP09_02590 [Proteobacteria bacterium]|nr:MAG: hypothetical protein EOP09_02590 [Pseudomonadota bacterium]
MDGLGSPAPSMATIAVFVAPALSAAGLFFWFGVRKYRRWRENPVGPLWKVIASWLASALLVVLVGGPLIGLNDTWKVLYAIPFAAFYLTPVLVPLALLGLLVGLVWKWLRRGRVKVDRVAAENSRDSRFWKLAVFVLLLPALGSIIGWLSFRGWSLF